MHILVVEDEVLNREAIAKLLRKSGFDVAVAENGLTAFDLIERHKFDAIVSDLRMPELGGASFYEQLEERYPTLCSRTVFVTAVADEPPVRAFLDRTGQPVIVKPFDPPALVAKVREIARRPHSS